MPSPIGHSIIGCAIYAKTDNGTVQQRFLILTLFLLAANLPDIDLAFGLFAGNADSFHHKFTHSFVFCAMAAIALGFLLYKINGGNLLKNTGIVSILLLSHLLLDTLTLDTRTPYGQMLLWPFSDTYIHSPITVFQDIQRIGASNLFFQSLLSVHNLFAVFIEIIITGTIYLLLQSKQIIMFFNKKS